MHYLIIIKKPFLVRKAFFCSNVETYLSFHLTLNINITHIIMNNFLFVAAENDGIANCKAGGMGDVVRDVPRQISE